MFSSLHMTVVIDSLIITSTRAKRELFWEGMQARSPDVGFRGVSMGEGVARYNFGGAAVFSTIFSILPRGYMPGGGATNIGNGGDAVK